MLNWLIGVLINTVLLMAIDGYFDDIHFSGIGAAFLASVVLAVLNAVVRPVLILLTLPVTVLTLGLFLFVINAITLMMTAGLMGDAFQIGGFGTALLASIVLSFFPFACAKSGDRAAPQPVVTGCGSLPSGWRRVSARRMRQCFAVGEAMRERSFRLDGLGVIGTGNRPCFVFCGMFSSMAKRNVLQ